MPEFLENAIMKNDHVYVDKGLNQFEPVPANSVNEALQTGLMIACLHKSVETVKVFLKKSTPLKNDDPSFCNVNHADAAGSTALHFAVKSGSFECVNLLIEHGANTNAATDKNATPLHLAAQHNRFEIVRCLMENHAKVNANTDKCETPLHLAAENNCFEIVKFLMDNQADINARTNKNETPLHMAAQNNCFEIAQLLIEHKAEIDSTTTRDETALFLATVSNHPDIVKMLAKNGCPVQTKAWSDFDIYESKSMTALEFAVNQNFVETAVCLLCHLSVTKELGERELRELFPKAAKEGLTNIANELIIHGADVNSCIGINLNV